MSRSLRAARRKASRARSASGWTPCASKIHADCRASRLTGPSVPHRQPARELQKDFPRIPFPLSAARFAALASLGSELLGLHLLRDERLLRPRSSFSGDSRRPLASQRPRLGEYREHEGRIDLNDHGLCFEGVTPEAWRYRIGGHQVLARWLRARRGRVLPSWEVSPFRWMAEALERTLALQARLAAAYGEVEEGMAVLRLETGRNGGGCASCT